MLSQLSYAPIMIVISVNVHHFSDGYYYTTIKMICQYLF